MPKGADSFIQKIAKEAGAAVLKRFGKDGIHYMKSERAWDSVTKADLLSEKIITSRIRKRYPEHSIISEESGVTNDGSEYTWIIDPIDGTMYFADGIPLFVVLIALAHKKKIILSAIYLPVTKELFFAKARKGAYRNGKRIHCSNKKDWNRSIGCAPAILNDRTIVFFKRFLNQARGKNFVIDKLGGINEPYVALGRRDWCVSIGARLWDYAPGYLILKESGCIVTNLQGKPWEIEDRELIAANPRLHKKLLKLTKGI